MKFETYKDKKQEWRWRLVAKNGKTVADSGEGYKTRRSVLGAITSIKRGADEAPVL